CTRQGDYGYYLDRSCSHW
nr:immunoglobulin heavy chain junction region [Macaca mulatta]